MKNFNGINTKGIDVKQAIEVATRSEKSRNFSPTLNGLTVGLSTGTSGNKGLFLVSKQERAMWVALILQRIIGWKFRKRKIAFFLGPTAIFIPQYSLNYLILIFLIYYIHWTNTCLESINFNQILLLDNQVYLFC